VAAKHARPAPGGLAGAGSAVVCERRGMRRAAAFLPSTAACCPAAGCLARGPRAWPESAAAPRSAGNLWVALGEAGAVACYDARSGARLHHVKLPARRPTACTFGGPGLATLYVTTRVETGPDASPHWGGVFAVRVPGVAGAAGGYPVRLPAS